MIMFGRNVSHGLGGHLGAEVFTVGILVLSGGGCMSGVFLSRCDFFSTPDTLWTFLLCCLSFMVADVND